MGADRIKRACGPVIGSFATVADVILECPRTPIPRSLITTAPLQRQTVVPYVCRRHRHRNRMVAISVGDRVARLVFEAKK